MTSIIFQGKEWEFEVFGSIEELELELFNLTDGRPATQMEEDTFRAANYDRMEERWYNNRADSICDWRYEQYKESKL